MALTCTTRVLNKSLPLALQSLLQKQPLSGQRSRQILVAYCLGHLLHYQELRSKRQAANQSHIEGEDAVVVLESARFQHAAAEHERVGGGFPVGDPFIRLIRLEKWDELQENAEMFWKISWG